MVGNYMFGDLMLGFNYLNVKYLFGNGLVFIDMVVFNIYGVFVVYCFMLMFLVVGVFVYMFVLKVNGVVSVVCY